MRQITTRERDGIQDQKGSALLPTSYKTLSKSVSASNSTNEYLGRV